VSRASQALAALLLGAVVLALYGRVLGYGFVYDDVALLESNRALADWRTLPEALGRDLFHFAEGVRASPYWRPVVTLSYYVDHAVGGGRPWAFHGTNLGVLWAASLGLVALLVRGGASAPLALALAVLFLAHPSQVEGAANAAGRTDLLVTALGLWALLARRPWLAGLLALLACGAKEIAVVLPVAAWLLDRAHTRWRWQAAAVALFLVLRAVVLSDLDLAPEDAGGPTAASLAGTGSRVLFWLGRLLVPTPAGPAADLVPAAGLVAAAGWLAVLVLALAAVRARPERAAAGTLVLLPLLLVSGLVQGTPRYGDTLTVLPLAGLMWLSGSLVARLPRALALLPLALSLPLGWAGSQRLPDWSSSEALWGAAHARTPDDRVISLGLARVLATTRPRTALAVSDPADWPSDSRQRREAATVAARAHLALDEEDAALGWLSQAVADDPEAAWANGTACVLLAGRGSPAGEGVCVLAIRWLPDDPDVLNARGIVAVRTEGPAAALPWFTRAAELAPERPEFAENRDRAARAVSAP